MTNEEILAKLIAENLTQDPTEGNVAWLDEDDNKLYILNAKQNGFIVLWSPDTMFKHMSAQEINEFIIAQMQ